MYIADTLSRAYLPVSDHISQDELEFIRLVEDVDMTAHRAVTKERLPEFQQKTKDDPVLQQLKRTIELEEDVVPGVRWYSSLYCCYSSVSYGQERPHSSGNVSE